ncbi:hypothetical protein JCM10049v2_006040 [Rhodotorula toruloides]
MSSPDLEALLRMAATMGLGPDVIKQVRANPDMLRRLAEGVRASASSGITSPASSTETDMQDLLKQHADAARAVAEREKRLPPRHPPRKDRDDQMREMEAGRRQAMEVQSVGEKGFQFSFIGMPKASSLVPLSKLQPIVFDEMQVTKTHEGRYLAVRIVSRPAVMVGITFLAEDVTGRSEVIAIYNLDLHGIHAGPDLDAFFPLGTILVVREPTFKMNANGTMSLVRMDSPTDFELVRPGHPLFSTLSFATPPPVSPRTDDFDFKALGNKYFVAKKDLLAVKAYTDGLAHTLSPEVSLLLRLNRSQAHLRLENFASAYHDSSFVLKQLDEGISGPPQARLKATIRLARAFEGMRHLTLALEQFGKVIKLDTGSKEGAEGKKRIERKLRERDTGGYDWRELEKLAETQTRLDVGDFIGPIKVVEMQGRGGGRGVVATRDIEAGEVLLVEAALGVGEPPKGGMMLTLDFQTNTATKPSTLDLVLKLASRISDDPTVAPLVYGLHGGARFPPSKTLAFDSFTERPLPVEGEQQFVDIARLEAVCSTNTFSAGSTQLVDIVDEDAERVMKKSASSLFLGASLFNHSCSPNARWSPLRNVMVIRSRTSIRQGDEVFLSYVAPLDSRRPQILQSHFPAGCKCSLCLGEALDGSVQIARRASLKKTDFAEIQKAVEELRARATLEPKSLIRLRLRLQKILRQLEATYSQKHGAFRPEMATVYHTMGELTDPTQSSTRDEGNRFSIKALTAAGAVLEETTAKVKVVAAPCSDPCNAVPQLLNIAHRYNRSPAKPQQARKWVMAAFEMNRILYGDDWSRFVERYVEDIKAFKIESVVKDCGAI